MILLHAEPLSSYVYNELVEKTVGFGIVFPVKKLAARV